MSDSGRPLSCSHTNLPAPLSFCRAGKATDLLGLASSAGKSGKKANTTKGGRGDATAAVEPPFVVARHLLDFGNVVSGTVRTLRFKVGGQQRMSRAPV